MTIGVTTKKASKAPTMGKVVELFGAQAQVMEFIQDASELGLAVRARNSLMRSMTKDDKILAGALARSVLRLLD